MRPELRDEMLRILKEFVSGEREILAPTFGSMSSLGFEAIELLKSNSTLAEVGHKQYRITIQGYDYYEELRKPRIYRFKKRALPEFGSWTKGVIIGVIGSLIVFVIITLTGLS